MINNIDNEKYDDVSRIIAINLLDILNINVISEKCGIPIEEIKMFEKAYKKGEEESKLDIAKRLLGTLNVELIAEKCNLPLEEVIRLSQEYDKNN